MFANNFVLVVGDYCGIVSDKGKIEEGWRALGDILTVDWGGQISPYHHTILAYLTLISSFPQFHVLFA